MSFHQIPAIVIIFILLISCSDNSHPTEKSDPIHNLLSSNQLDEKPTIIVFWESWSELSIASLGKLNNIYPQFKNSLNILAVDPSSDKFDKTYRSRYFPTIRQISDSTLYHKYAQNTLPLALILNEKGKILTKINPSLLESIDLDKISRNESISPRKDSLLVYRKILDEIKYKYQEPGINLVISKLDDTSTTETSFGKEYTSYHELCGIHFTKVNAPNALLKLKGIVSSQHYGNFRWQDAWYDSVYYNINVEFDISKRGKLDSIIINKISDLSDFDYFFQTDTTSSYGLFTIDNAPNSLVSNMIDNGNIIPIISPRYSVEAKRATTYLELKLKFPIKDFTGLDKLPDFRYEGFRNISLQKINQELWHSGLILDTIPTKQTTERLYRN